MAVRVLHLDVIPRWVISHRGRKSQWIEARDRPIRRVVNPAADVPKRINRLSHPSRRIVDRRGSVAKCINERDSPVIQIVSNWTNAKPVDPEKGSGYLLIILLFT